MNENDHEEKNISQIQFSHRWLGELRARNVTWPVVVVVGIVMAAACIVTAIVIMN